MWLQDLSFLLATTSVKEPRGWQFLRTSSQVYELTHKPFNGGKYHLRVFISRPMPFPGGSWIQVKEGLAFLLYFTNMVPATAHYQVVGICMGERESQAALAFPGCQGTLQGLGLVPEPHDVISALGRGGCTFKRYRPHSKLPEHSFSSDRLPLWSVLWHMFMFLLAASCCYFWLLLLLLLLKLGTVQGYSIS